MTPAEYKKFLIDEIKKIKNEEHRIKKNKYMKEYNKKPEVKKYKNEYNKKWNKTEEAKAYRRAYMRIYEKEYRQRPEVKARLKKQRHDKYLREHNLTQNRKPNYPHESFCAVCKKVWPKGLRCPECGYRMRNGPTRKKEVFRY
jgi:hypothetical protein